MRQVVQGRKGCAVGQSRSRLDDTRLTVRASVRDLEDTARLAAQLPRDGIEIRPLNHRDAGHREGRWSSERGGLSARWWAKHRGAHRRWCATATCTRVRWTVV